MRIYTRAEWGARFRAGYGPRPIGALKRFLHHGASAHLPEDASFERECAAMRGLELTGQVRFGTGISYTTVTFPSGRVFEGAGITRVSAHSGAGRNTSGAGLCFAGNYDIHPLGSKAAHGMATLLAFGVEENWWTSPTFTEAHRDFKSTACPGRNAYSAMGSIEVLAARILNEGTGRDDDRDPINPWTPAVKPELINERLALMGIKTAGRPGDYDRAAVTRYQEGQVYSGEGAPLVADGLWGPKTEAHFLWVVELQTALVGIGCELNRDGWYGPWTADNVGFAQKKLGLVQDEEAGPITCARLGIRSHP